MCTTDRPSLFTVHSENLNTDFYPRISPILDQPADDPAWLTNERGSSRACVFFDDYFFANDPLVPKQHPE
jgi:hypothetical protein